jgi:hypothetical protein
MLCDLYLRKGTVFVPTLGKMDGGPYRDIEPVDVVPVSDTEGLRQALHATIARGNPSIGPYPRPYPPPVVLKHAGLRSWHAFARGTRPWSIRERDGSYQIIGRRDHPDGWVEDPDQTIHFPAGTTLDDVIDRMIAILQTAADDQM